MVFGIIRKGRKKNLKAIQELNLEILEEKFQLEELCYKKFDDLEKKEILFMQKELKKFLKVINESLALIKIISDN